MAGNVNVVANYLRRKGLTPAQTAGVIGVMQGESGKDLSTTAKNPSSGAFGIAQWLGGRKSSLLSQKNPTSIKTQLDHLWSELQGPERAAYARLKKAHSIDESVNAFLYGFERPGPNESNIPGRTANARSVFNSIKNTGTSSTSASQSGGQGSAGRTVTTPGVPPITIGGGPQTTPDPAAEKRVILANLLKREDPHSLLLRLGVVSSNEETTKTTLDPGVTIPGIPGTTKRESSVSSSGPVGRSKGVSEITGPNPSRVIPAVRSFMDEISSVRGGKPVVGSDGTGHSYLTVDGKVSEHSTGHASDIPASGRELINLGQAALIAAGMPRAEARQQTGGLFNVYRGKRRFQIIFNTQKGGDHTDHLHVGVRG